MMLEPVKRGRKEHKEDEFYLLLLMPENSLFMVRFEILFYLLSSLYDLILLL